MSFEEFFSDYENENNCSPEKYECYKAGAQSRQAEIDELKDKVNREREEATEYFTDLEYANAKCNELQKRINSLELEKTEHIERMNKLFGGES